MGAAEHDIDIEIGATFFLNVTWKDANDVPINLTGYDARMQVRQKYTSATPVLSFTTGDGSIVLGGALGTIAVKGLATVTDDVTAKYGVYDLEMIAPNGDVYRILKGVVNFDPEATR